MLGGVAFTDADHPVDRELATAMTGRIRTGPRPEAVSGPGVLLFAGGEGAAASRSGPFLVAADLDLVNEPELEARTGATSAVAAVLHLYEREGAGVLGRLRGGFAVAIWDDRDRSVLLGVDHFGIKRLYYARRPGVAAFASRAAAVLAVPGLDRGVSRDGVYHYLAFGYVPAPGSPFEGVRRLPPGHLVRLAPEGETVRRYWDLSYRERPIALREAASRTLVFLSEAVARALGPGPVKDTGTFLSGGTDSSTVLGLATRLGGERFPAFSIGFAEARFDELGYARIAARHFNAAHTVHVVSPAEALAALPALVESYDEPFGNESAVGTFLCARIAAQAGMSRLLAGDGGDEIFGGNERYRKSRLYAPYQRLPAWLRRRLIEPVLLTRPDAGASVLGRARRYVRRARIPNPRRLYSWSPLFPGALPGAGRELLHPDLLAAVDAEAPWRVLDEHFERPEATSELNRILYLDMKLTIGDNDLLKVTRTAEAAGVTVRFPMLDVSLVEFTSTLPARFKVRGLEKRVAFKRAVASLLPAEILAKRKHGFGVPVSEWLREHAGFRELARDTLLGGDGAGARAWLRADALARLFELAEAHPGAGYGERLWTLLMLALWERQHVARRPW
jgi:asparagine synthase (glutamine-hydrolysing)